MARAIDSEVAFRFLTEQLVKETGAFSKGVNKGLNIARSAMRNPDAIPTLTPPNEWVSVDNKLPKNGVPVLIGNPHWDYPVVASCAGYGVWMDSWHQKMTFTPTCWMPLPERPKEDE